MEAIFLSDQFFFSDVDHKDLHEADKEGDKDIEEEKKELTELEIITEEETGDTVTEEEPTEAETTTDDNEGETQVEEEETHVKEVQMAIEELPRPPPKPHPRRSVRERKPPVWHDAYQMNQMVPRQYDSNLQAFDVLINSGVLNRIDTQVAKRLLDTLSEEKY